MVHGDAQRYQILRFALLLRVQHLLHHLLLIHCDVGTLPFGLGACLTVLPCHAFLLFEVVTASQLDADCLAGRQVVQVEVELALVHVGPSQVGQGQRVADPYPLLDLHHIHLNPADFEKQVVLNAIHVHLWLLTMHVLIHLVAKRVHLVGGAQYAILYGGVLEALVELLGHKLVHTQGRLLVQIVAFLVFIMLFEVVLHVEFGEIGLEAHLLGDGRLGRGTFIIAVDGQLESVELGHVEAERLGIHFEVTPLTFLAASLPNLLLLL